MSSDQIPNSLTVLCIVNCHGVASLPDPLPAGLIRLHLIGWCTLTKLPDCLPSRLADLNITNCPEITELPHPLPNCLACLNVTGCEKLTALLIPLPASLKTLIGAERLPQITQERQEFIHSRMILTAQLNLMTAAWDSENAKAVALFKKYFSSEKYLWGTKEAEKYPRNFLQKQINLLTQIKDDSSLRCICFDLASKGMADCADNAASNFQQMQEQALACRMMKPGLSEGELIQYGVALKNHQKLMQLVVDVPEMKRGVSTGENVEAYSALCLLCHELNISLPVPVISMRYEAEGWEQFRDPSADKKLTANDIKQHIAQRLSQAFFAGDKTGEAESMTQFLVDQPFWQTYLQRNNASYVEKISMIHADAETKQAQVFDNLLVYKNTSHTEAEFRSREINSADEMNAINQKRIHDINALYIAETKRLLNQGFH